MSDSMLVSIISSDDTAVRNRSLWEACAPLSAKELLAEAEALEAYRHREKSLYHKVRALFFLHAIHRYHLPNRKGFPPRGRLSFPAHELVLDRRFGEAIGQLLREQESRGPNDTLSSALAHAYHALAFQTLADQVRRTVRSTPGNTWIFRMGHSLDHPLSVRSELLQKSGRHSVYPLLLEQTAVRMDLTHCAWSDIFFLGMDFPEGARVLNVSVDLGVHGRDAETRPPVEAYLRVIEEPVLRLTSVDLGATAELREIEEVFDFARDYLGLLKAAVIASGFIPPGLEGSGLGLDSVLQKLVGPGRGIEIVSNVNRIPKGSRLAVSTNLLGALIAVCMRATGQTRSLSGPLTETERRIVAARAILGEWLGGSGGGWQDSGGVWPGIKLIEGEVARPGDAEHGASRGKLLPRHTLLGDSEISPAARQKLQDSLVLVHGGMAQNVGPILEMVTEKYLTRGSKEWTARLKTLDTIDRIVDHLKRGEIEELGRLLTDNFFGPLQDIIPWVSNIYTETLISDVKQAFGDDFWGFWMLGGMSGGGMGFVFSPAAKQAGQDFLKENMLRRKKEFQASLPFAMDPVVYDFRINENGSTGSFLAGDQSLFPEAFYHAKIPSILRCDPKGLTHAQRSDLQQFASASRGEAGSRFSAAPLVTRLLPDEGDTGTSGQRLHELLKKNGFDRQQHEQIKADIRAGRIGMAMNRLPASVTIEDVQTSELFDPSQETDPQLAKVGSEAIRNGEAAIVTFAAGVGSRWTQGAGVVKSLHAFAKLGGAHRNFIDIHLAKTRRVAQEHGVEIPHVFTTSYLTHQPIERYASAHYGHQLGRSVFLSPGRSIGLRMVPTERDLRFQWEELAQQKLDEQKQKVVESARAALLEWARQSGEASDYTDNLPAQCLHPVGHWYEIPNLLKNGVLKQLLDQRPNLEYLIAHNIDTLGAALDPTLLGWHKTADSALSFEVISKRVDDRGGGLAKIDGKLRLIEGMALPRENDEFGLTFYNTNTSWISVSKLLDCFGLTKEDLSDSAKVSEAVRALAMRMPTYLTLKDVKKRWGEGQEDVYPVSQFEKLWGDMTSLPQIKSDFAIVSRNRGQQLKDQAQLDGWVQEDSAEYIESLCEWGSAKR